MTVTDLISLLIMLDGDLEVYMKINGTMQQVKGAEPLLVNLKGPSTHVAVIK